MAQYFRGIFHSCMGTMDMFFTSVIDSLTTIRFLTGTKNSRPVGFYSRNSTKSTFKHKHNNPQHYHHGGAVCPLYGVGSMDPPDWTRVTSSKGFGRGVGVSVLIKYINFLRINTFISYSIIYDVMDSMAIASEGVGREGGRSE